MAGRTLFLANPEPVFQPRFSRTAAMRRWSAVPIWVSRCAGHRAPAPSQWCVLGDNRVADQVSPNVCLEALILLWPNVRVLEFRIRPPFVACVVLVDSLGAKS